MQDRPILSKINTRLATTVEHIRLALGNVWHKDGLMKSVLGCRYLLKVKTANELSAETDNILKIRLSLDGAATRWIVLPNKGKKDFDRNQ